MRRLLRWLTLLLAGCTMPALAAAQTPQDVQATSTRVTRVSIGTKTTVYGSDSIVVIREDRAVTRFLIRPKAGRTLPQLTCTSTRSSRVAAPAGAAIQGDSILFWRLDQDSVRALCKVVAVDEPTEPEHPEPEPDPEPQPPPPPAPPPAPPPPPPAAGVWIQEDFSGYSSTADLLRYPNPTWTGPGEDVNTGRISLDADAPPVGGKSMRYDFPDRSSDAARFCHDYTIGRNIRLPAEVTELWVEAWIKFEPVFETLVPSCLSTSGNAYKTFFVRVRRNGAFTFVIGTNGPGHNYTIQRPAFSDAYHGRGPTGIQYGDLVDGRWHLLQQHVRTGTNGLIETRIDGVRLQTATGFFDGGNIYALALGRNMNQGPDHPQSLWWGRVRAWRSDPGWGW